MMQTQKRPREISVIAVVAAIVGIIRLLVGLGLVSSAVSLSDLGVDTSGIETKAAESLSLYIGLFDFAFAAFCFITVLSILARFRFAWKLTIMLSMIIYATGFLAFKSGEYVDGVMAFVLSSVIMSLIHTSHVKEYLRKII